MRAIGKFTYNCCTRYAERGGGSATTLVQTNAKDESVSSRGVSKVLHPHIDFLCHGKTNAAIKNHTI